MTEYVTIEKTVYEDLVKIAEDYPKLKRRVEELERLLHAYDNPNTPSSKQRFKQKRETPDEPAKRGAPGGHQGATRKIPDPDKFVDTKPTGCKTAGCNGNIQILNNYKKKVLDLVITPEVTEFTIYRCRCLCCGREFETTDPNLPKSGIFGPTYTSLMEIFHYMGRIPFGNLANISTSGFDLDITAKGLQDVVYRTAQQIFEADYQKIFDVIQNSQYVRGDETHYPYNKNVPKWWLWNFSNGIENLVMIRPSRGSNVLEECLHNGKDYDGILQSDFYKSYQMFKNAKHAGCWRHLLGDSKELAEDFGKEGEMVHNDLKEMYAMIVKIKDSDREGTPYAECKIREFHKRFLVLSKRHWGHREVKEFIEGRLIYFESWLFNCMRYREAEPTNNSSERDIRKPVCARNISGCHRSMEGVHSREIMTSVILTELHKGNNPMEFIRNRIMQYNNS